MLGRLRLWRLDWNFRNIFRLGFLDRLLVGRFRDCSSVGVLIRQGGSFVGQPLLGRRGPLVEFPLSLLLLGAPLLLLLGQFLSLALKLLGLSVKLGAAMGGLGGKIVL